MTMRCPRLGGTASVIALGLIMAGGATSARAQVALTAFNFNNTTSTTTLLSSTGGLQTSQITTNFNAQDVSSSANGTTLNAVPGDSAGSALLLQAQNNQTGAVENGNFIQFGVDTSNYYNIKLSLATQGNANGFTSDAIQYSLTGPAGTFTTFGTYTPASAYGVQTFDFSSISGLTFNPNATFRIVFNGASTTSKSGNNLIDNLVVTGVAAPEPGSGALVLGAVLPVIGGFAVRRRRS